MSIRIYALSKQLNVDHVEILDAVRQLGIQGKSTPLASLTDEETIAVKKALSEKRKQKNITPQGSVRYIPPSPQKSFCPSTPVRSCAVSETKPKQIEEKKGTTTEQRKVKTLTFVSRRREAASTIAQRLYIERFGGWVF